MPAETPSTDPKTVIVIGLALLVVVLGVMLRREHRLLDGSDLVRFGGD